VGVVFVLCQSLDLSAGTLSTPAAIAPWSRSGSPALFSKAWLSKAWRPGVPIRVLTAYAFQVVIAVNGEHHFPLLVFRHGLGAGLRFCRHLITIRL
jgi:hypothetical protein